MPSQATLGRSVSLSGRGYFSGERVTVELRPAPPGHGIVFVRTDCGHDATIPAHIDYRVPDLRRTTVARGAVRVEMIEHIMAALAGMAVDNCEVAIDAPETPAFDGSSVAFVEAIDRAGVVEQSYPARSFVVTEPIRVGDDSRWLEARPHNRPECRLHYELDYTPFDVIGRQSYECVVGDGGFARDVAPARSFLLVEEARQLRAAGLGRHVTYQDVLVFDDDGPIENRLRYEDECVRHKTLDLIGDLALCGFRIEGIVVACCTGHERNAALAAALAQHATLQQTSRSA